MADFSTGQIERFVRKWFTANGKSDAEAAQQWKTFGSAVSRNPALKELTVTPVLLSLMCLVLQDEGKMPTPINWLYEKGIRLLLSKWNDARQIDGWEFGNETYRDLSIECKEALLIEIAARKFEHPLTSVLFEQEEIAAHITQFLQLADSTEGVTILKAIEAQHGLLIERADELWSFSHLTFQEHFTLRWLSQLSPEQISAKLVNPQWQERVKQLVKSQPADYLLRSINQALGQLISKEPTLQKILGWVLQKSESTQANYKPAATRAFYFAIARVFALSLALNSDLTDLSLAFNSDLALALGNDLALVLDSDLALALNLNTTFTLDLVVERAFAHALDLARALDLVRVLARALEPELANSLEHFRATLPAFSRADKEFQEWWQTRGGQWIEQLHQVIIQHGKIVHDWQLTSEQIQQFQHYYDTNRFLVELINIDGAVSAFVRAEIEDSLLLPWEELQRRYPDTYGQSQSP